MSANLTSLGGLLGQAWATVKNPREGLTPLLGLGLDRSLLWQALVAVVALSAVLAQIDAMTLGLPGIPLGNGIYVPPWTAAFMQFSGLVITVFAVFWIGRAMGGTATFGASITAVAWLQFIMVCLQTIQSVLYLTIQPLGSLLAMAGLVLFFYLLTQFITIIHGFLSPWRVFGMILLSMVGISFGLVTLLALIGVSAPGPV